MVSAVLKRVPPAFPSNLHLSITHKKSSPNLVEAVVVTAASVKPHESWHCDSLVAMI